MSLFNFSSLAFLWPFANEADKTLFVYKQHDNHRFPPNDARAIITLAEAIGPLVMDNSSPDILTIPARANDGISGGEEADATPAMSEDEVQRHITGKHVIYVGGSQRNEAVRYLLEKCQRCHLNTVVHLLREGRSKSFQVKGKKMFTAEYYDDEQMRPRVDYGKAMLTFNPYDRTKKSLLLFGLNAQGTLAAARAITRRDLSGDVVRRLVANYHLPPRLLGVVEVVVRGAVAEDGTLKKSDGLDDISVEFVAVNGLELYPQPDRDNVRGALLDLPPEEKGLVLRVRDPDQPTEDSIRIAFKWPLRAGPPEGSALAVPGEPNHRLEHRFFDHFSDRDVVVIAPHSDDCALGCGGLIYYLRHTKLWEGRRPREDGGDPRPEVHVLVMTKGLGGIDEDALAAYYVATGVAGISNAKDMARVNSEMRSEIRYNESLSEALLLDTKTVWLDLNLKTPEAHAKMRAKLWELRTKAFARRRALTVLIPGAEDEHPTHRDARELVLRVLGQAEDGYEDTRVWAYQGPWARPTRSQVTVILPLDKYAMFAKCQAIAMHQSQEARTRYSDVARTQARLFAETVPEQVFGYGATESGWDYLEVYHELHWETVFYQRRVPSA